jgi:FtsP/CotA-like multicopper oxidase with cupredoxin domain
MSRMTASCVDRRQFVQLASAAAFLGGAATTLAQRPGAGNPQQKADYTLRIAPTRLELAPGHVVSTTAYNGQFPGPLVRLKEGRRVTVDIHNQTATPEQLHWHGQKLPVDVDGAAEEGTPFIPARGMRRISFVPGPPRDALLSLPPDRGL